MLLNRKQRLARETLPEEIGHLVKKSLFCFWKLLKIQALQVIPATQREQLGFSLFQRMHCMEMNPAGGERGQHTD